jgi:hypothetical protein
MDRTALLEFYRRASLKSTGFILVPTVFAYKCSESAMRSVHEGNDCPGNGPCRDHTLERSPGQIHGQGPQSPRPRSVYQYYLNVLDTAPFIASRLEDDNGAKKDG